MEIDGKMDREINTPREMDTGGEIQNDG